VVAAAAVATVAGTTRVATIMMEVPLLLVMEVQVVVMGVQEAEMEAETEQFTTRTRKVLF
jgi:hypothetical protein